MVTAFDEEYKLTKLVKQGKASLPEELLPLAKWINKTYDVKTLNIIYDFDKLINRPRLQVIFEYPNDKLKFVRYNGNFDEYKQNSIAWEFKKLVQRLNGLNTNALLSLFKRNESGYQTHNLLVVFSAFEPLAKEEANEQIPDAQIQELKTRIANKEIWDIVRSFSSTTFFFYTDAQVKKNEHNGVKEALSGEYFDLLKQYDEFDYLKREGFSVLLDSKENFDKNYKSSWFYYFR